MATSSAWPTSRFEVPAGLGRGMLGSNGAGKTTTLKAVAGIVPVSEGTVTFDGEDVAGEPPMPSCAGARAVARGLAAVHRAERRTTCCWAPRRWPTATRIPRLLERGYAVFPQLAERRNQTAGHVGRRTPDADDRPRLDERAQAPAPRRAGLGLSPAIVDAMYDAFAALHKDGQTILFAEQSVDLRWRPPTTPTCCSRPHRAAGPGHRDGATIPTSRRSISGSSSLQSVASARSHPSAASSVGIKIT